MIGDTFIRVGLHHASLLLTNNVSYWLYDCSNGYRFRVDVAGALYAISFAHHDVCGNAIFSAVATSKAQCELMLHWVMRSSSGD